MVEFSIVLPAHNEAPRLANAAVAVKRALGKKYDYELIIAEDGSTDGSYAVAKRIAAQTGNVRVLHSDEKLGRGLALKRAFSSAKGKYVAYMDVDLATNIGHARELLDRAKAGADAVTGSRYLRQSRTRRSSKRLFFSSGYNTLVRLLLGSKLHDHQCGFKAFKKSAALDLCKEARSNKWFWDTEVLVLAQKKGLRVEEFPIEWNEQRTTTMNFKADILGMGAALFELWWRLLWAGLKK
ncbi:MAG: dolichyl-phosphate beta-glucosyltransferase [Candidatus Micrarchaeia archaeon]|jgi:hypothetical protein